MFPFSAKNLKLIFNYSIGFSPFGLHGQVYTPINNQIRLKDAVIINGKVMLCFIDMHLFEKDMLEQIRLLRIELI
jgi:hypothetical protein